jgi:putative restriction endonuclease
MAYWIVYQGNSFDRSRAGGYMWAPKVGKRGQTQAYWATMARVQPGDIIFSGVDNAIRAVSQAAGPAYDAERPDPRDEEHWYGTGWRLDVAYTDLPEPLFYRDWVPSVLSEMPGLHSPFTSTGRPNQGYLFELPLSVGEYVVALAAQQGLDVALAAAESAAPLPGGETQRQAVIKARIGQGQFRKDLLQRWHGRCAVSGVSRPELLRASHIKPWSSCNNQERLDPDNGLLLSAAYDAAFDALLIGFAADGAIYLAADFGLDEARAAGIEPGAKLTVISSQTVGYLVAHAALVTARVARSAPPA